MEGHEFVHSRKLHCRSGHAREHRRSRCHAPRRILRGHARSHRITTAFKTTTVPVGAVSPANTGAAGAIHRVAFFAGKPAPTGSPQPSTQPQYLWERACPRTPAQPVPYTALHSSRVNPLPQAHPNLQRNHSTCGSGHAREHRHSRCHAPRRILRGHARSHRITTAFKAATVPVGAGSPANTGAAGAIHRVAFFTGKSNRYTAQQASPPIRTPTTQSASSATQAPPSRPGSYPPHSTPATTRTR